MRRALVIVPAHAAAPDWFHPSFLAQSKDGTTFRVSLMVGDIPAHGYSQEEVSSLDTIKSALSRVGLSRVSGYREARPLSEASAPVKKPGIWSRLKKIFGS